MDLHDILGLDFSRIQPIQGIVRDCVLNPASFAIVLVSNNLGFEIVRQWDGGINLGIVKCIVAISSVFVHTKA
jgi:hypothetical protein